MIFYFIGNLVCALLLQQNYEALFRVFNLHGEGLGGIRFMCSICLLLEQTNPSHHLFHLISLARQLKEREWTVKLSHTYKEDNFAADHLASLLHSLPVGSHLCNNPSFTCKTLLYRDMTGFMASFNFMLRAYNLLS